MVTTNNPQVELLGKIAAYTELLIKDPGSTIFVSLAEAYRKMGLLEDAKQIIVKGLEHHADFCPAHIVLARIECQLENFEASRLGFARALSLDSNSLAALVGFARLNLILKREEEARQLLLRARKLSPGDPTINKLLLSLPSQPAVDPEESPAEPEAEGSAQEGLSSLVSTTLADLYLKQGIKDKALQLYRQLLLQNPDNSSLRDKIRAIEATDGPSEPVPMALPEVSDSVVILNLWLKNIQQLKARRRSYV